MDGVKISEIPGAMVEKYVCDKNCRHPHGYKDCDCGVKNHLIDQQGQVRLSLSRENLAEIIYEDMRQGFLKFAHPINDYPEWDKADDRWRTTAYRIADSIIEKQKDLFVTVK